VSARGCAAGLDVGGTFLKGARVDADGVIEARFHEPVAKGSGEDLFHQLARAVACLESPAEPVRAVGVGLPGLVDEDGRVRRAPNVPVLNGLRVGQELALRCGRRAFAENDANAAALAEAWIGAGQGARHLLFVTLGTGVGGALVLGGRLFTGCSGYAGEIGHLQVEPDGLPCGCGSWGCLETVAGNGGWTRRAEEALARRGSSLQGQELSPANIVAAARQRDPVALEVVEGTARALGVGLAAALDLLNLDRVVIGGGVAGAGEFLLASIVEQVRQRTFADVFAACEFRLAALGGDAGVVGAARVALLGLAEG